jgi:RNA polymerase sigma factor (sigma-70 family)
MGERVTGGILGSVGSLFREGTVAGLTDAQLLERYAARDDPAAFEALVSRYGPMVLGVCRRRLRDRHAAEDAFQATFLVLIRKAGSVRAQPSLGPWIHGVAWKVAERARADAARRRDREAAEFADDRAVDRPEFDADRRELAVLIDEELARLPEKYRAPVVLCHLEGLTHEEAADRLGCPTGTVSVRLMRARARLKERLTRRGTIAEVPPFLETLVGGGLAGEVVPAGLIETTIQAATGTGAAAPLATRLAEGVIRAMMRSRLRRAAIGLSSIGVLVALAARSRRRWSSARSSTTRGAPSPAPRSGCRSTSRRPTTGQSTPSPTIGDVSRSRSRRSASSPGGARRPSGRSPTAGASGRPAPTAP